MGHTVALDQSTPVLHAQRAQMDSGTWAVLVGGAVAIVLGFFNWLWPHLSGRKKMDAEARKTDSDASASLSEHIVTLLSEFRKERTSFLEERASFMEERTFFRKERATFEKQLDECIDGSRILSRRIDVLERLLQEHNIALPKDAS